MRVAAFPHTRRILSQTRAARTETARRVSCISGNSHSLSLLRTWNHGHDREYPISSKNKISWKTHWDARGLGRQRFVSSTTIMEDQETIEKFEKEATTTEAFETVLYSYCAMGDIPNAERVLTTMEELALSPDSNIIPTSRHYSKLIETLAEYAHALEGAPQRAQAILEHMEQMVQDSTLSQPQRNWRNDVTPTVNCYHNVMKTWVLSNEPMFASRVQKVFNKLANAKKEKDVVPNMETFDIMIHAWCSSKEQSAVYKVSAILKRMEDFVRKNELNSVPPQTDILDVIVDPDQLVEIDIVNADICYPTLDTYKSVLTYLAHSKEKVSAYKAHGIVTKMEQNVQTKASNVKPDLECYRLLLCAWSKTNGKDAAPRSETLLSWMEDNYMRPDRSCYSYVIHTLAHSSFLEDAAERADAVLLRMEDVYKTIDTSVEPTWNQYYDVISAWAKDKSTKDATVKAMKVLKRMESFSKNDDTDGPLLTMNATIYTAAMKVFRNPYTDQYTKAKQVLSLHERMLDDYMSGNETAKPTVESFNTVLQVCSKVTNVDARTKLEAFGIASKAFQDLREAPHFGNPDNGTYRRILECCSNLLPPGRKQLEALEKIFQNCCRDGLVDDIIHDHIRQWVSLSNYKRMIVPHVDNKKHTLPASWSENLTRNTVLHSKSIGGKNIAEAGIRDHLMKGLREKTNQKILRGGRI